MIQGDLAQLVGFSTAMLSQIERGEALPSDQAADRLMDLLGLDEATREHFCQALKRDRAEAKKGVQPEFATGTALRDVLKRRGITNPQLTQRLGRPVSTVNRWVAGSLFPGSATIAEELIPTLTALGAESKDIQELKFAAFSDDLARWGARLDYLSDAERESIVINTHEFAEETLLPQKEVKKHGRAYRDLK
jgi:transcriptional regulator with XRE-family HTH domain